MGLLEDGSAREDSILRNRGCATLAIYRRRRASTRARPWSEQRGIRQTTHDRSRIDFRDVLNFVSAWAATTLMLKSLPLEYVVNRVRARKIRNQNDHGSFEVQEAHRLMTAYFILRPNFFSDRDACLRDSLTFVEFFARYGMYPTWMFGVRVQPFAAHSWVQEGDMVLNDYLPRICGFTPIMAV